MSSATVSPQDRLITGEELANMPGVGPCELIDGRIVPMSPTGGEHGRIEVNIVAILREFVRNRRLGRVFAGEVGIFTRRDPDRVRAADAAFITNERYERLSSRQGFLDVAPELVVEVLSPSDPAGALVQKLREYFAAGVLLVWVVDPEARAVLAHRSLTDVREFRAQDRLPGDDVLPGFETPVAAFFED